MTTSSQTVAHLAKVSGYEERALDALVHFFPTVYGLRKSVVDGSEKVEHAQDLLKDFKKYSFFGYYLDEEGRTWFAGIDRPGTISFIKQRKVEDREYYVIEVCSGGGGFLLGTYDIFPTLADLESTGAEVVFWNSEK